MLPMAVLPWNVAIVVSCVVCVVASVVRIAWLMSGHSRRERWVRWYAIGRPPRWRSRSSRCGRRSCSAGQHHSGTGRGRPAAARQPVRRGRDRVGDRDQADPGGVPDRPPVTRRWRAAIVASITAGTASVRCPAVAPSSPSVLEATRCGTRSACRTVAFISNQSLNGAARLNPGHPSTGAAGRDDFRTEVLGLVKAQQVKNAVIVPVGPKGGFYPKRRDGRRRPRRGRERLQDLPLRPVDITDNLHADGTVIPPKDVIVHDGDRHLVVAADKGTATFSDIANGVAEDSSGWATPSPPAARPATTTRPWASPRAAPGRR